MGGAAFLLDEFGPLIYDVNIRKHILDVDAKHPIGIGRRSQTSINVVTFPIRRRGPMPYTREGIMAQVYVAFGQGTGEVRVSQEACTALYDRYWGMITEQVLADWGDQAV